MQPPAQMQKQELTSGHMDFGEIGRAFFDVKVFNPNAQSYCKLQLSSAYKQQEKSKKRKYEERSREVERGSFTPLIFTTTGGLEIRHRSPTITWLQCWPKRGQSYSTTISWLRCRLSFSLLRSAIICLRGARSHKGYAIKTADLAPIDLVVSDSNLH